MTTDARRYELLWAEKDGGRDRLGFCQTDRGPALPLLRAAHEHSRSSKERITLGKPAKEEQTLLDPENRCCKWHVNRRSTPVQRPSSLSRPVPRPSPRRTIALDHAA